MDGIFSGQREPITLSSGDALSLFSLLSEHLAGLSEEGDECIVTDDGNHDDH